MTASHPIPAPPPALVEAIAMLATGPPGWSTARRLAEQLWQAAYVEGAASGMAISTAPIRIEVPSITCPRCGATSYNPNDVREGYCGRCHDWTGTPGAVVASIPPAPGRQDASLPSVSTRRGPSRSVAHRVAARLRRRPPTWYAVPIVSPHEARLRAAALDGHVCRRIVVRTGDR